MANSASTLRMIETRAGTQPEPDNTAYATEHYTYTQSIRFKNGLPEKIGGYAANAFDYGETIEGVTRSIYSVVINNLTYTMVGTNSRLYVIVGSRLTNITPTDDSLSVTVGDTLQSDYAALANNPVNTVNGSNTVTIADANASKYRAGIDSITLSGATTTNGVPDVQINGAHVIKSIVTTPFTGYTFDVATAATSTGAGGGASVNRATGLVTVTSAAHGLSNGDRVKIKSATTFAGLTAIQLNVEAIIRNITANTFDYMTGGTATSSATGGGASAAYDPPIPAGLVDEQYGQGYGAGLYGVGLYGVAKTSIAGRQLPRIWYFDRYGDYILMTPGNQSKLYQWDGVTTVGPVQVPNSPATINYFFVSDNIVVTFGALGIENRIKTSNQNGLTVWTATAENEVYDDTIEGASRLLSSLNVRGTNLLFTETKVFTFTFIGLPNIWEVRPLGINEGIISPLSRAESNGIGYWMGQDNYYQWRGGNIEEISSNSQPECTALRYVFDNLNVSQKSKAFCWFNSLYNELTFHYPSTASNEPDRLTRISTVDNTFATDFIDRTAAEAPQILITYPRLASADGVIYNHEFGTDADGSPLTFTIKTNLRTNGKNETLTTAFIPDSIQTGDINVTVDMYQWPQAQTLVTSKTYTISPTSGREEITQNGRFWQYTITGSQLGQTWRMGKWAEECQKSGNGR